MSYFPVEDVQGNRMQLQVFLTHFYYNFRKNVVYAEVRELMYENLNMCFFFKLFSVFYLQNSEYFFIIILENTYRIVQICIVRTK